LTKGANVTADLRQTAANPPRYRHPATRILLGLFVASELFLNLWFVARRYGGVIIIAGAFSPYATHGFPEPWLYREFETDEYRTAGERGDRLSLARQNLRIALPCELLIGDFSRATFYPQNLLIDAAIGVCIFLAVRWLGDACFGFRPSPAYRREIPAAIVVAVMLVLVFNDASDKGLAEVARRIFDSCVVASVVGGFIGVPAWVVEKERLRARAKFRFEYRPEPR
jgi:hypothetical protein